MVICNYQGYNKFMSITNKNKIKVNFSPNELLTTQIFIATTNRKYNVQKMVIP